MPKISLLFGWILSTLGVGCFMGSILATALPFGYMVIGVLIGGLLAETGRCVITHARQKEALAESQSFTRSRRAASEDQSEPKQPIGIPGTATRPFALYLRSFRRSGAKVDTEQVPHLQALETSYLSRTIAGPDTVEMRLAKACVRYADLVALGEPGERLPELGAVRLYFSHANWREEVRRLIQDAAFVLMRPMPTPSILEELGFILELIPGRKFALFVPRGSPHRDSDYRAFHCQAVSMIPCLPDPDVLPAANFLTFDDDWVSCRFIRSRDLNMEDVFLGTKEHDLLSDEIRKIAAHAWNPGVPLPPLRWQRNRTVVNVMVGLLVVGLLALTALFMGAFVVFKS